MTDINGIARRRKSARDIRNATFTQRRRGLDPDEVQDFLNQVADQVQAAADERAALVGEIERLRSARASDGGEEANTQAVTLLSQAQLVADRLVEEHEQRSRHLLSSARARQRDMLQRQPGGGSGGGVDPARGYVVPVPDIEYVRTYTRIAQTQLRTVLEALAEQVDKLGELPQLDNVRESPQQVWNR